MSEKQTSASAEPFTCIHCEGEFFRTSHAQKYCTSDCRMEADHENRKARQKRWRDANVTASISRNANLKHKYGISSEEWEAMFEKQGRKCVFGCVETGNKNWATDHDHETGEVRAILCNKHNLAIGWIERHQHELFDLLAYIENHKN